MSRIIRGHRARILQAAVSVFLLAPSVEAQAKPNFVLVLLDDLGWRDFGVQGSTFYETPAIDQVAKEGTRFTRFYSSGNVCSPTRSALVTGKHPGRTRNTQYFGGAGGGTPYVDTLSAAEVTVGEAFREAGYATAHLGKWHLGSRLLPPSHGFDLNVAGTGAGHPASYFSPYQNARLPDGPSGEYLTDRLSDEAVAFIEDNRARPFFLLLAHYAPHTPLQAKAGLIAKYQAKAAGLDSTGPRFGMEGANQVRLVQDHATYAAMIESVDQGVAKIMAGLRRLGLDSNTAVIVTSDNGGLSTSEGHPTSNVPLRAGKGWLYEGGIRVPFIARWPGRFAPGKVTDSTATTTDLYPTLLQLAGLAPRPAQHLDGLGFADLLLSAPAAPRAPLFWHYPHTSNQGGKPGSAMRLGRYKLIEFFQTQKLELYDLVADPGEKTDLSRAQPQRTAELFAALKAWRESVNANMPPTYQPPVSAAPVPRGIRPPKRARGWTASGRKVTGKLPNGAVTIP